MADQVRRFVAWMRLRVWWLLHGHSPDQPCWQWWPLKGWPRVRQPNPDCICGGDEDHFGHVARGQEGSSW